MSFSVVENEDVRLIRLRARTEKLSYVISHASLQALVTRSLDNYVVVSFFWIEANFFVFCVGACSLVYLHSF